MKTAKLNFSIQKQLLNCLADKLEGCYLVGGTALALYYFRHRESHDLDFFTGSFSQKEIAEAMSSLRPAGIRTELIAESADARFARTAAYMATNSKGKTCKIDFVEDLTGLIQPTRAIDGIHVASLDDIYLKKLYAVAGHTRTQDDLGRNITAGGRQEAKDFYDLYCLSSISTPLAQFVSRYGTPVIKEGVIRWYRTFDRVTIKTGLLDLVAGKMIDFRQIERHFKKEIDALLLEEIG